MLLYIKFYWASLVAQMAKNLPAMWEIMWEEILLYLCIRYSFPVVMYGCESWTIKKAEHRRIDAFELWCWIRPCKEIKPVHPKGNWS